jgi:hypothetical protein
MQYMSADFEKQMERCRVAHEAELKNVRGLTAVLAEELRNDVKRQVHAQGRCPAARWPCGLCAAPATQPRPSA